MDTLFHNVRRDKRLKPLADRLAQDNLREFVLGLPSQVQPIGNQPTNLTTLLRCQALCFRIFPLASVKNPQDLNGLIDGFFQLDHPPTLKTAAESFAANVESYYVNVCGMSEEECAVLERGSRPILFFLTCSPGAILRPLIAMADWKPARSSRSKKAS